MGIVNQSYIDAAAQSFYAKAEDVLSKRTPGPYQLFTGEQSTGSNASGEQKSPALLFKRCHVALAPAMLAATARTTPATTSIAASNGHTKRRYLS